MKTCKFKLNSVTYPRQHKILFNVLADTNSSIPVATFSAEQSLSNCCVVDNSQTIKAYIMVNIL